MLLIERFRQVAQANPGRIALIDSQRSLTYRELAQQVQKEAADWRAYAGGARVPLVLPRGAPFVVRLLALWTAGMVPVPIDPESPPRRLQEIEALALTPSSYEETPAYAIATSGSSGRPKLVEVLNDGLLPMLDQQIRVFEIQPGHRVLWMLSPGFDASLSDVLTALLGGATLICGSAGVAGKLPQLLAEMGVTHLDIPPALLATYTPEQFPSCLRTLVVGGAPSEPGLLRGWADRFRVVSVYGPTEATVCSSLSVVDQDWDAPYLGQPITGLTYRVDQGELLIGGPGVARGYVGANGPSPFWCEGHRRWYRTGDLVKESRSRHGLIYAGRIDRQLKLHGQRIEPEEIEARLRSILGPGVAVVLTPAGLSVFWEGPDRRRQAQTALREALPKAWQPRLWRHLSSMPRLPNGKIDFEALACWEEASVGSIAAGCDSLETLQRAIALEGVEWTGTARFLGGVSEPRTPHQLEQVAQNLLEVRPETPMTRSELRSDIQDDGFPTGPLALFMARSRPKRGFSAGLLEVREPRLSRVPSKGPNGKPTLLVTGASGRLGRALLPWLAADYEVLALQHHRPVLGTEATILQGDLSLPRLGLSKQTWRRLASQATAVLHLAARLDARATFDEMLEINAVPLLTLAQLGRPIHLASTLSVVLSVWPPPPLLPANLEPQQILGSYAQSKWVAERLWQAVGQGGRALRYGLLLGDPDGQDLLGLTIQGLVELGCFPLEGKTLALDITPMDYAAKETVRRLRDPLSRPCIVVVSSGVKLTLGDLVEDLASLGFPLTPVPAREFFTLRPAHRCAAVAQLALGRLQGGHQNWDLFAMSETDWLGPAACAKGDIRAAFREYSWKVLNNSMPE
jgi:acyl-CoA synthetase (AMP-forming)/AMP-acid ligase II/nucleoside-diphosphate-sugar epimerase